ncbi:exo-alpha-sialidase [Hazenella sp. IB182353]|uniref:sialidase family protein n=1 Tax=Polycladospora coralii TaxID=2771432 RepID=UPI001746BBB7|nr:sialidase family protein [Polycladospora coralii]MBS7528922.1 exo-alpha-sialidase [Polycladospora coralii]
MNAAVEPFAAVNPTTVKNRGKENIICVYQQDRYSNGAASSIDAGVSLDGGRTWRITSLPFNQCVPGGLTYERASDPWISFGSDGTAYVSALAFSQSSFDTAIATVISTNRGKSWSNPRIIRKDVGPTVLNDKDSITVDPNNPKKAYVVWTRFTSFTSPNRFQTRIWFAKTKNRGKSWQTKVIFAPKRGDEVASSVIVAAPKKGLLHHFFTLAITKNNRTMNQILIQTSNDSGETWSKARIVTQIVPPATDIEGAFNFLSIPLRTSSTAIFSVTMDNNTGTLYVSWEDARFSQGRIAEIALSSSIDGGQKWRNPVRVNETTGNPAFIPTVAVNQAGRVGVSYYQCTNSRPNNALPVQPLFKVSNDRGRSFSHNGIALNKPFNILTAPFASRGFFVGDYESMITIGNHFFPVFTNVHSNRDRLRSSIYIARINPSH